MIMDAASADRPAVQLAALFDRYHREIYGYLAKMLRDRQLAEDLLQETFLRAFRARRQLSQIENPRAWLYRIATNLALDACKRRRRFAWLPWNASRSTEGGADIGETVSTGSAVDQALRQMPPDDRSILMLYDHFGFTITELAETLGTSQGAVRTRLYRAHELFRSKYEKGERG